MRRILLVITLFVLACNAQTSAQKLSVKVSNSLAFERIDETIEIPWSDISSRLKGAAVDRVVVVNGNDTQVPSQVIFAGETEPQALIFQVSIGASSSADYTIKTGVPEKYPVQAYGRFVPERADDYAWENNMAAYRLYGPALKDPLTPGIDVWVKCTPDMVIDKWYKLKDYHTNRGEGMDCYKVGVTLGGGGCAPLVDGKLWFSANYATQERLDNGPIRTSVKLTYAPFKVGDKSVTLTKIISLDANTPLSKMTNIYSGSFGSLPVAAGIVMHKVKDKVLGKDYVTLTEEVSDSRNPQKDGDISVAVVMPTAKSVVEADGHLLVVGNARNGKPLTYWSGAGWSQSWVKDAATWNTYIERANLMLSNPLKVKLSGL